MPVAATRHRFTVADYHRMAEARILHEDDRLELIEGEIIATTPIGPRHAACVNRLTELLLVLVKMEKVVAVQNPVRLGEHSEPQPDVAVLRFRPDYYAGSHPTPEEIFLLVEVCESSIEYDRDLKAPLYAEAGIPELWLVSLEDDTIEVLTGPGPGGYRSTSTLRRGDTLHPTAFSDVAIPADSILGE